MSSITTHPSSRAGDRVFYKLSEYDVREIVQKRRVAGIGTASGNEPREGDEYPALIIRDFAQTDMRGRYERGEINLVDGTIVTWEDHLRQAPANLQVFLDGNDVYWATSRTVFDPDKHGRWDAEAEAALLAEGKPSDRSNWSPDAKGHWFKL